MPQKSKKRLNAESRRALILAKAKVLFSSKGYPQTSMDDIATAAGVTKPVVYDHFASKRDLYVALMKGLRDELLAGASEALSTHATPSERFRAAIENYFRHVQRDATIVELLFVQSRHHPDLSEEWERLQSEAIANLKPLLNALAPGLAPWQLNVAVHFLHHGLNATAEVWPKNASATDMANLVTMLLWRGLESVSVAPKASSK